MVAARARRERHLHLQVLQRHGFAPDPAARVLDFGCGNGASVHGYLEAGFDAWGCDMVAPDDDLGGRLRTIRSSPYRLPFGDGEFDLVYSEQVFEHVMNPDQAIRELSRVLRPHGVGLHFFPSRYRPIECHVLVPLAGTFRPRWWFGFLGQSRRPQRVFSAALVRRRRSSETNSFFTMRRTTGAQRARARIRQVVPGSHFCRGGYVGIHGRSGSAAGSSRPVGGIAVFRVSHARNPDSQHTHGACSRPPLAQVMVGPLNMPVRCRCRRASCWAT
jgi:SAM-dependent methyltransferase